MAILNPLDVKVVVPTPTPGDFKARTLRAITSAANGALVGMAAAYLRLYQTVWADAGGLDPQAVIDLLGPDDAPAVLSVLNALATAINSVQPGVVPPLPSVVVPVPPPPPPSGQ